MAQTAAGEVTLMTSISQCIPFQGKLSAATEVADAGRDLADATVEATTASVTADLRRAWWRRWETTRALVVLDDQHYFVRRLQQVAGAWVAAGRGGQEDLLRLDVELAGLDIQASALRATTAAAEARIRLLALIPPSVALPAVLTAGRPLASWQAVRSLV